MQLKINTVEYDFDGRVTANINGKNKSTLKLDGIYELSDKTSRNILTFPLYSKVELIEDGKTLFRGVIKESTPTEIGNRYAVKPTKIQIYDYKDFLSDGILISRTFRNANPREILDWVSENLSKANEIQFIFDTQISFGLDIVIESWTIQDGTPYDILNELANRTNSRFWVRDTVIYFRSWAMMTENYVEEITTIKHDDFYEFRFNNVNLDHQVVKIDYQDSSSFGYANSIVVRSRNVISSQTFTQAFPVIQGQRSFTTNFDVGEIKEVWLFDSRFENWRRLFVRETRWTESPYNQWYEVRYSQGSNVIEYNENLPQLLNGQTLYVDYYSIGRGVSIQNNDQEIERVINSSGYGDGRIVYIEEKDDITSQFDLDNYAISLLDKMSTPRKDFTITTGDDFNLAVSDMVKIDEEFYVVDSIHWDHLFIKNGSHVLSFEYNLTNTKNDNQQINFYDNRLLSDLDVESVLQEEAVNAQLTMNVSNWEETTTEYDNFAVRQFKPGQYEIVLMNKDNDIFYQETKLLESNQNYELEVSLIGEPMEWKIFK